MKVLQQNLVVSIIRKRYLTAEIIEAASSVQVLPERVIACWGIPQTPDLLLRAGNALLHSLRNIFPKCINEELAGWAPC